MSTFLRLSITAAAAFMLSGAAAAAGQLPTYEITGFPITPHQFSVLGSASVQERSRTPTLTQAGMPASPHQIAVLTPRLRMTEQQIAEKITEQRIVADLRRSGFTDFRFMSPSEYTIEAFYKGEWTKLTVDAKTGTLR